MSTITTKQLRENMSQVIRDLKQGKSVALSYRHSVIGVLQPIQAVSKTPRRGSPEAIRQALHNLQSIAISDAISKDSRSMKEQIAEIRDRKY
jgi:antitoxin (DNA-binding transcriptional repressor) of toxin-antitoxin stability system